MTRTYYRGAKAAIVCYDITKLSTFQRAKHWVRELRDVEEHCKVYLCATKKDLCDEGFVSDDPDLQNTVERYAKGTQTKLFITSSKTGENVGEDASYLVNTIFYLQKIYFIYLSFFFYRRIVRRNCTGFRVQSRKFATSGRSNCFKQKT